MESLRWTLHLIVQMSPLSSLNFDNPTTINIGELIKVTMETNIILYCLDAILQTQITII